MSVSSPQPAATHTSAQEKSRICSIFFPSRICNTSKAQHARLMRANCFPRKKCSTRGSELSFSTMPGASEAVLKFFLLHARCLEPCFSVPTVHPCKMSVHMYIPLISRTMFVLAGGFSPFALSLAAAALALSTSAAAASASLSSANRSSSSSPSPPPCLPPAVNWELRRCLVAAIWRAGRQHAGPWQGARHGRRQRRWRTRTRTAWPRTRARARAGPILSTHDRLPAAAVSLRGTAARCQVPRQAVRRRHACGPKWDACPNT